MGRKYRPPRSYVRSAAHEGGGAGRDGTLDEAGDPLEVPARHQRADVGRLVARVAQPQRRRLRQEPLEKVVGDRLGHQQPYGGQAHLTGVVELLDSEVGGEVEVGVVEDEQRRLAAELNDTGVTFAAAAAPMARAVGTEPVKQMRRTRGSATSAAPASVPSSNSSTSGGGGGGGGGGISCLGSVLLYSPPSR